MNELEYLKEKRIEWLLSQRRMFFYDGKSIELNRLNGLYDLIKEHVKPNFKIVEIGSFEGMSTELFSLFCSKIYAVDPYQPYKEIDTQFIIEADIRFHRMVVKHHNIVPLKQASENATFYFEDNFLDMVYIDGAHNFENVCKDIKLWMPKIKSGGIISGHDYNRDDVKSAVKKYFPNSKVSEYRDTSWAVVIKEVPRYFQLQEITRNQLKIK